MEKSEEKKILIIKEEQDAFELFCSEHMRRNDIEVMTPYVKANGIFHYLRAICKRSNQHFLQGIWMNKWKKKIKEYDYVIVFDNCATETLLKWISMESPKNQPILWLWNIPRNTIEPLKKYSRVACFDEEFCKKNGYKYVHQFYFPEVKKQDVKSKYDFVFVGADKNRYSELKKLADYAERNKLKYLIYLYDQTQKKEEKIQGIIKSNRKVSYEKLVEITMCSKAIVELNITGQKGLTLRALESIFLDKKLITNNLDIEQFDFYNTNNIFVYKDSLEGLDDFLQKQYNPVKQEVLMKYTFEDWLVKVIL